MIDSGNSSMIDICSIIPAIRENNNPSKVLDIKGNKKVSVLINQLLRSGTSIGANIHEANYASSKADFINKFQISLKECYETDYWLDLFKTVGAITPEQYADMFAKCSKIRKLLIASIRTAKGTKQ